MLKDFDEIVLTPSPEVELFWRKFRKVILAIICAHAAKLIRDGWCIGTHFRNARGLACSMDSPNVRFRDVTGALIDAIRELRRPGANRVIAYPGTLAEVTDNIGQALQAVHLAQLLSMLECEFGLPYSLDVWNDNPDNCSEYVNHFLMSEASRLTVSFLAHYKRDEGGQENVTRRSEEGDSSGKNAAAEEATRTGRNDERLSS